MTDNLVTIFGGTGFLGQRIAARVLESGWRVRIAVRRPRPDLFFSHGDLAEQVTVDVRDPARVTEAVGGAAAIVNAVSLYVETRSDSFESLHVSGARNVARAAERGGARLMHLSGIGVDPDSPSSYVRARFAGELAVRETCGNSVILRPSVLFGPGDAFLSTMVRMVEWSPLIPLFGTGDARLQPVHVEDVARAVLMSMVREDARGRTFELGGPDVFTYREFLRCLAQRLKRRRILVPVPFPVWNTAAAIASPLPNPPITRNQIELMRRDNMVRLDSNFQALSIDPESLQSIWDMLPPKPT